MKTNWHDWMRDVKKIDPNDKKSIELVWAVVGVCCVDFSEQCNNCGLEKIKGLQEVQK